MLKTALVVIITITLLCLSGCMEENNENSEISPVYPDASSIASENNNQLTKLSIPYDKADSLNPFKLTSQYNKNIVTLIYDSLFKVDSSYNCVPIIVEDYNLNDNMCTLTIKDDIMFSDGTQVTLNDVLYSFELAKKSPAYSDILKPVVETNISQQQDSIIFTLSGFDALFVNLLTFPIVKFDTGELDIPIGSGRFVFDSGNLKATEKFSGTINIINLVELPARESVSSAIRARVIDYMFTPLVNEQDYTLASSSKQVDINSLVYLGVNSDKIQTGEMRRAIYLSLDRNDIISRGLMGKAKSAFTPFNPIVSWLPDVEFFDGKSNKLAQELLSSSGLNLNDGWYYISENEPFTLRLIVVQNQIKLACASRIKSSLESVGISVDVIPLEYNEYIQRIREKDFDLYLGEVKLKENMDILPLISYGNIMSSGVAYDEELIALYQRFRKDISDIDEFIAYFMNQMPFIPIAYRDGLVVFNREFPDNIVATECDIFFNIEQWS